MSKIAIRPDMRTSGGEVSDIMLNGRYVGGINLIYREGSRLSGSIQLEKSSLTPSEKKKVIRYVQEYVNSFAAAIDADDCDIIVTYSHFDQVIAMEHNIGEIEYFIDDDGYEADYVEYDTNLSDIGPDESVDTYEMGRGASAGKARKERTRASGRAQDTAEDFQAEQYELVITGEHGNSVEYHIYGRDQRWLAEAFVTMYGSDCIGEINWMIEPTPEQIESSVDLLVSDFDDDLVDSFQLEIKHNGELLELYELDHQDIADYEDVIEESGRRDEDYSVHLIRDDGDTLTYDIVSRSHGNLPVGTATVDISQRKLTGFMDFREMNSEEDREQIASLLMRELDKEKDYDSFNVTVLYRNRPIDELLFENTPLQ